jgi:tol-pal system protein YbgF
MRKTALLMLCAGLGSGGQSLAAPNNNGAGYTGQANYGAPAANSDGAMFEVLGRVEQLQSEVQQLRGMVEEQSQTIADLQRKQSNMYSDLDDRMQALSNNTVAPGTATVPSNAVSAASPVQPTVASPVPVTVTTTPVIQVPATQPTLTPTSPQVAVAPTPVVAASSAMAQGSEKERYQQAFDTLRNGHNQQAVKMFESLLVDYPAGEFADNAQYWLGEAYKINRDYDKARGAFNKVVNQYSNSSKVPDALLKLGLIESELQNNAKARDYLTRVVSNYPGTTAAHLASKKLAQMPQ